MKNYTNDNEKNNSRKIIILIIVAIIALSLITSCSCTSNFLGKIGDTLSNSIGNLFRNEEDFTIDDDTNDEEIITNKELKFDVKNVEMSLSDPDIKISFTYKKINPKKFTCSTSDANIATCYVSNGHVVIKPKSVGKVTVYLQTTVNGKTYQATSKIKINDSVKAINLSSNGGRINLKETNQISVSYNLIGISGDVVVKSSDNSIARATASNGNMVITALKPGSVTITISIIYNEITYKNTYKLNIVDEEIDNSEKNDDSIYNNDKNNEPTNTIPDNKDENSNTNISQVHTVRFEYNSYNLYLGNTYQIHYIIEENGRQLNENEYNLDDISVTMSQYQNESGMKLKKGYIILSPTINMLDQNFDLNISYKGKKATTILKTISYKLTTYNEKYDISFTNNQGKKSIILNTNLFESREVNITSSDDRKEIHICSNDQNICADIYVDKNNDEGNIQLEYVGNNIDPHSLPFNVTANFSGTSYIHVSGKAFGNKIAEFDIQINVISKYVVTIKGNTGMFNELTSEYQFLVDSGEEIDLSKYDEPYKIDKDNCLFYKFIGYSKTPNGTIEYNRTDKSIIKNINSNLDLYAIYNTNDGESIINKHFTKTLWITDPALFYNEKYFKEHNENKVIYPGAYGTYKMNLKNESSNKITIVGMTLKEDTICISDKGCLNMGYIIKYSPSESNRWTYYYGEANDKYWILHNNINTISLSNDSFKNNIQFKDNEKIEIEPNEEIVISIFWKWEDSDNELDTLIGNHVAKQIYDDNINDMYGLSVGINFETTNEYCR